MSSCNFAYTSAAPVRICGQHSQCADSTQAENIEGSGVAESDDTLRHCEPGYTDRGVKNGTDVVNGWPDTKLGNPNGGFFSTSSSARHYRVCTKDMNAPGASAVYDNIFSRVYDATTGRIKDGISEDDLGRAARCCGGLVSSAGGSSQTLQPARDCGSLLIPINDATCTQSGNCPIYMNAYCLGELSQGELNGINSLTDSKLDTIKARLEDTGCLSYCSNHTCTNELNALCEKIYTLNGNQNHDQWDSICGCHYPDELYRRSIESLSQKYVIPEQFVGASASGNRTCISSECNNSVYPRDSDVFGNCPGINLVSCITNASFEVFDSDVDNINISSVNQCPGAFSERTVTGNQAPATPPPTLDDLQDTANQLSGSDGSDGSDGDDGDDGGSISTTTKIIIGGSIALLILSLVLIFMPSGKSKTKSPGLTKPPIISK